jgi:hypothetical protein
MPYSSTFPSDRWAISGGLSASFGVVVAAQSLGLTLLDVKAQVMYGMWVQLFGLAAGIKASLTVSTFSPYFFTTPPIRVGDFDGSVTFSSVEFTPAVGGSEAFITFWGVDHKPYWLDIGGLAVGFSGGAGLMYGQAVTQRNGTLVSGNPIVEGWSADPNDPNYSVVC